MAGLPLLYFAGAERAGDLAAALGPSGRAVETVIAYRARLVSDFDAEVRAAVGRRPHRGRAALFRAHRCRFPRRRGGRGPHGVRERRQTLLPVGPGRRAARRRRCPRVSIAGEPNESALIDLIERP